MRTRLALAALLVAAPLSAQDIVGLGRNIEESPVVVGISGGETGWLEPDGMRVNAYVYNSSDEPIAGYELLMVGLNPFNVLRITRTRAVVSELEPEGDRTDRILFPYLGIQDVFTVIGVVTKVRFESGAIWVASGEQIRSALGGALAGLDLSALPLPSVTRRMRGAYVFSEMALSDSWSEPEPVEGCTKYTAEGPGLITLRVGNESTELIAAEAGDELLACGDVVHIAPVGG